MVSHGWQGWAHPPGHRPAPGDPPQRPRGTPKPQRPRGTPILPPFMGALPFPSLEGTGFGHEETPISWGTWGGPRCWGMHAPHCCGEVPALPRGARTAGPWGGSHAALGGTQWSGVGRVPRCLGVHTQCCWGGLHTAWACTHDAARGSPHCPGVHAPPCSWGPHTARVVPTLSGGAHTTLLVGTSDCPGVHAWCCWGGVLTLPGGPHAALGVPTFPGGAARCCPGGPLTVWGCIYGAVLGGPHAAQGFTCDTAQGSPHCPGVHARCCPGGPHTVWGASTVLLGGSPHFS